MLVLSMVKPDWRQARVWDVAPTGPASDKLRRECPAYLGSHYRPDIDPGAIVEGMRNEDSERPSLLDGSIDVIVSSDVFEHVVDVETALAQVARVLAAGGIHVWTVPRQPTLPKSTARVRRGATGLEYLAPAEYHLDPVCADGVLVTYDWGQDLPARVEDAARMSTLVFNVESRRTVSLAISARSSSRTGAWATRSETSGGARRRVPLNPSVSGTPSSNVSERWPRSSDRGPGPSRDLSVPWPAWPGDEPDRHSRRAAAACPSAHPAP